VAAERRRARLARRLPRPGARGRGPAGRRRDGAVACRGDAADRGIARFGFVQHPLKLADPDCAIGRRAGRRSDAVPRTSDRGNRMSFVRSLAAPAALTALALFATPASAADYVLRMATISDAQTPGYAKVMEPFARAVERDSGGRIEVALKPLGGYGKPADLFT